MINYYEENAQSFILDTLHVDMDSIYKPFIKKLNKGASILEIGCGSGRDLLFFKKAGFTLTGLEPCKALAEHARGYAQVQVIEETIQNLKCDKKFDAVWACASLLHIPSNELKSSLDKISQLMSQDGIFYASFKHGEFEGFRSGRFFNFQTIESIKKYITDSLKIVKHWVSSDQRKERKDEWLNIIMSKR